MNLSGAFPIAKAFVAVVVFLCGVQFSLDQYQSPYFWYVLMFAAAAVIFGLAIRILFYVRSLNTSAISQ